MNICSENHDEVCYEGSHCPVCQAIGEIEDLQKQIGNLETDNQTLKSQVGDLEVQLADK